jgi:dCMP deaminase
MSDWSYTWMQVAHVVAQRSKCDRAQVGAVIVDQRQRIIATGYNGPAAGFPQAGNCRSYCERANGVITPGTYGWCPAIHAEANALLYVDRSAVEGGTLYCTHFPCMDCAKLISNSGLAKVYAPITDADAHRDPHKVMDYLTSCGLTVINLRM